MGKPRDARGVTGLPKLPLPQPEDRLLFILALPQKTLRIQVVHGRLSVWSRAKPTVDFTSSCPHCWRRFRALGDAPPALCRPWPSGSASRRPDAATVAVPLEEVPVPVAPLPSRRADLPPFAMTDRNGRIVRPQTLRNRRLFIAAKKKDHTVKNVLLVNALLVILFLSDTHGGRTMICASRDHPPASSGSGLLQDLGFLSFTLLRCDPHADEEAPRCGADPGAQRATRRSTSGGYGLRRQQ